VRHRRSVRGLMLAAILVCASITTAAQSANNELPELTQPVNDFAHVIDGASAAEMDRVIRALQAKTGDAVIVVTIPTIGSSYGDIREYAVKLFANHGRGIGEKGKDNGLLILLALEERRVWVEVGYGLEEFITDGFSGETSRDVMAPRFREGQYGAGLLAGTQRIVGRIAQGRNVTLDGVPVPRSVGNGGGTPIPLWLILLVFIMIMLISRGGGGPRRRHRYWGGGPGWSSGVGPFGGGWGGGGFGGGGFGGGFGGFGGGRSGGGGGGASW
jgi:uncharacterized protein